MNYDAYGYFFDHPLKPLEKRKLVLPRPKNHEVIVKVISCGLCHTDLGFFTGDVRTNKKLPLILGHETVGKVIETGENAQHLFGKNIIIPAVLPCGNCFYCKNARSNACIKQKMPGNDINGGFASHILVPSSPLIPLNEKLNISDIYYLSVVADAVSTAWQACKRAKIKKNDIAFIIGVGGVGNFVSQIANAIGAYVVAGDINIDRLNLIKKYGAQAIIVNNYDIKLQRKLFFNEAKIKQACGLQIKIFECSGTTFGQSLAFSLLQRGSTMVQVGFTTKLIELRFSNIMAFDADILGSWGCPPEEYVSVLKMIENNQIKIKPFSEISSMYKINDLLHEMKANKLKKRMILTP